MRRTSLSTATLLSLVAVALAGCGAGNGSAEPSGTGVSTGAPAPAAPVPAAVPAAVPADCADGLEPNASLAPGDVVTDPRRFAAGSTMAEIRKRGYLRVATNGDVVNWGVTDPTTGDPQGFDVDVAAEIAEALGLDPARTVYTVIPYSERQRVLGGDRVDLVAQQMTITCARWAGTAATGKAKANPGINLSVPYYTAGARLLVRTGTARRIDQLRGQPVCGTTGSTSLAALADQGLDPVEAPSAGQCLVMFEEGEVAAVVGDETTLSGFKVQDPATEIIGSLPESVGQYGLGTQPDQEDFTRFVNAVLLRLRGDGTLDRLYAKWMKPAVGGTAPRLTAPVYGRAVDRLQRVT